MTESGLKRHFTGECAHEIAALLRDRAPGLNATEFAAAVDARIGGLELKGRVMVIAEELRERLPMSYLDALGILTSSLGEELREDQGMFTESWFMMPIARYVEEFGLDHPKESLDAIEEITKRHTGEYAIRPYLRDHHDLTMKTVERWARSSSHNVRRLATEGIRPRLPWAAQYKPFVEDPSPVVGIIDGLIDDPSLYVRTSVANNLNDIAKDHPGYAVATAQRWLTGNSSPRTRWIVTKGLRTLIKKGDPSALKTVGAEADPGISVREAGIVPARPRIGEGAEIWAEVTNEGPRSSDVIVDYHVHFRRPDGSMRPSTFKLGRITVPAGGSATIRKRHSFRVVTTRTLHPGEHALSVQANGNVGPRITFELGSARS